MHFFVTGGAGCVGLAVVERLLDMGADVLAVDLIDLPASALRRFADLPGRLDFRRSDLRDPTIARALADRGGDLRILHCAVITPTAAAERQTPRAVITANIDTTATVMDLARDLGAGQTVHVSSGGVYGDLRGRTDLQDGLVDEVATRPMPQNLYAISKRAGEEIVTRYESLFDLPVFIARVALTFGPWERITGARGLVSAPHQVLALARAGKPIRLLRDSHRGWTSSRDTARALVALAIRDTVKSGPVNVSTPHRWALSRVLTALHARLPGLDAQIGTGPANVALQFDFDAPNLSVARLAALIDIDGFMTPDQAIADWLDWAETCWDDTFDRLT